MDEQFLTFPSQSCGSATNVRGTTLGLPLEYVRPLHGDGSVMGLPWECHGTAVERHGAVLRPPWNLMALHLTSMQQSWHLILYVGDSGLAACFDPRVSLFSSCNGLLHCATDRLVKPVLSE